MSQMKTSERINEFMQGVRQEPNTNAVIKQSAGITVKRVHLTELSKELTKAGFGEHVTEPGSGDIATMKVTFNMKDLDKLQLFAFNFKKSHQ